MKLADRLTVFRLIMFFVGVLIFLAALRYKEVLAGIAVILLIAAFAFWGLPDIGYFSHS